MTPAKLRILGAALAAISLIALAISTIAMAQRLSHRQDLADRPIVWFGEPILDPAFNFLTIPCTITIVDAPPPAQQAAEDDPNLHLFPWPGAQRHLTIEWRGHTAILPIVGDDQPGFPGLMRFEDWLRITPMARANATNNREIVEMLRTGQAKPRLIIAARYPAEGFDPESWGLVRRQDWPYAFIELHTNPDHNPPITLDRATYRQLEDAVAPGPYSKPVDLTEEQFETRRWQHAAMLQVTPDTLYRARDKQVLAGMEAMGWTWPVAGLSVMGIIIGFGIIVTAGVRRP